MTELDVEQRAGIYLSNRGVSCYLAEAQLGRDRCPPLFVLRLRSESH